MKLVQLQSGTIDLVTIGDQAQFLQFNCSCEVALPYCQAMCCKQRENYNVELNEEESKKFGFQKGPNNSKILPIVGNSCFYLGGDNKCTVHNIGKPATCKEWHCSPGGVGEGLKVKAQGWILIPTQR